MLLPSEDRTHATSVGAGADREDNPRSQHHYRPLSTSRHFSPCEGKIPRRGLSVGGRQIRTLGPSRDRSLRRNAKRVSRKKKKFKAQNIPLQRGVNQEFLARGRARLLCRLAVPFRSRLLLTGCGRLLSPQAMDG